MKNMHPYYQTLWVVWGNLILFFGFMILFFNWYLIPLSIISMYIFACMSETAMHRYFAHKSYKTTDIKHLILMAFAFLTGQGAILSWVAVHRSHHAFEDTERDPHSPHHNSILKLYLGLFKKQNYKAALVADLLRSKNVKYLIFENKYYWLMWTALWIISWLISPLIFFFIVSGSALWYLTTQTVNVLSHQKVGKKTYPDSVAINNSWINLLSGAGHHNNHHGNPGSYTYKVTDEIDVYAWVIRKFLKAKDIS
jgi:stearoyl-CoA desaturase (Delta-9 desaturase)